MGTDPPSTASLRTSALVLAVLAYRRRLRQRDHWSRPELLAYQRRALARLRGHAYQRSPFYGLSPLA